MKDLLLNWPAVEKRLANKYLLLFLDYDGTLSPIAKTPSAAKTPQKALRLLRSFADRPDMTVAVISGRSLRDISHRIGIKKIIYSGNHGMEIEGQGMELRVKLPAGYKKKLGKIKSELLAGLSRIKGILIEDKGYTLSLHYRLVQGASVAAVKEIVNRVAGPWVRHGKKILEVYPPLDWDKGKAVLWLLRKIRKKKPKGYVILPVYIGDDTTDEDAFSALKGKGLTVFVGKPKKSQADYYLKEAAGVIKFLELLKERKK